MYVCHSSSGLVPYSDASFAFREDKLARETDGEDVDLRQRRVGRNSCR